MGEYAVDTKYRLGSGDSGTLKKFKQYAETLKLDGFQPIFLILRTDNLSAALTASVDWNVHVGDKSFEFIVQKTGFNLKQWLIDLKNSQLHLINR